MIFTVYHTPEGQCKTDLSPGEIAAALQDRDGLLWVDLVDEPVISCRGLFRDTFGFHPLAVDDALEETHVPKVDDWGEYLYLALHAVQFDPEGDAPIDTSELDILVVSAGDRSRATMITGSAKAKVLLLPRPVSRPSRR